MEKNTPRRKNNGEIKRVYPVLQPLLYFNPLLLRLYTSAQAQHQLKTRLQTGSPVVMEMQTPAEPGRHMRTGRGPHEDQLRAETKL